MASDIGVDESGKGDYFGYLVVAAVHVKDEARLLELGVKDSKKLSDSKILELDKEVRKICDYNIVKISPEKYNFLYEKFRSLNKLLAWAQARSIENILSNVECDRVITDKFGKESFLNDALLERGRKAKIVQETHAEKYVPVAAASIIARAEFLRTLRQLGRLVGFVLPKGATHVEETAKQITEKHGKDILNRIAKVHFKTTKRI